jgi:hypothetical protein
LSCTRALEIDLPEFLADSSGEEFAGFREHYPTCAACAAEIRAWTELHLQLGRARGAESAHPAEELLLRFEERPDGLRTSERLAIEAHLETCRSCREELRTLGRFDASALPAPGREGVPKRGQRLYKIFGDVGRILAHPAFAYALVLILIYPTIVREWAEIDPGPGSPTAGQSAKPEQGLAERAEPRALEQEKDVPTGEDRFSFGRSSPVVRGLREEESGDWSPGREKRLGARNSTASRSSKESFFVFRFRRTASGEPGSRPAC